MSDDGTRGREIDRRTALVALGGLVIAGCTGGGSDRRSDAVPRSSTGTAAGTAPVCTITRQETAGPFVLDLHDDPKLVRRDVTEGRTGVPLSVTLTVLAAGGACAPLAGRRVDLWQCDRAGVYSGFEQPSADTTGQTFLRGIQTTGADGTVRFSTLYPGWYPGRAPHLHYQVFLADGRVATSQLAFPEPITHGVYESPLYRARGQADTSNRADSVFADGTRGEMLALAGDVASGYRAALTVGVERA